MNGEQSMIIYLLYLSAFVIVIERIFPNWKLPKTRFWYVRTSSINAIQVFVAILAGHTWNKWMYGHSIFVISEYLAPIVAGFLAYFANTFVTYWWHRWRHYNVTLWRIFHQMHHSPKRIEMLTSFYKHPAEMVINSIIGSTVAYVILGINLEAGAFYIIFAACGEIFYHSNLKTPRWIGYFYQRPEMHRVHHKEGFHYCNFSDFPIWDQLFGTYKNPKAPDYEQGFKKGLENKFFQILMFRDVNPKNSNVVQKESESLVYKEQLSES